MMKEIYARGPVAACMACPFDEFEKGYTGGIFATTNNRTVRRRCHEPTTARRLARALTSPMMVLDD